MRTLHLPERNGRWTEIAWDGDPSELHREAERAAQDLLDWQELLEGESGTFLHDKFPELPVFKGLEFRVGRDGMENDEVMISDADGTFGGRSFRAVESRDATCVATRCDGAWHAEVAALTRGGVEKGREFERRTYCWLPFTEFALHVAKLAEAMENDLKARSAPGA